MQANNGIDVATSTQDENWMVQAGSAIAALDANLKLTINNQPHKGPYSATLNAAELSGGKLSIRNDGPAPTQFVLTTSGNPLVAEPALSQGYGLSRRFLTLSGQPLNIANIKQNQRFVIVLDVVESKAETARLLVVDHLPAGLEIENPDILAADAANPLPFLSQQPQPQHTEYRDDRFIAAFNRSSPQNASFSVGYIVRAVTVGHFIWPAAGAQDMYRPARFGRTDAGFLTVGATQ